MFGSNDGDEPSATISPVFAFMTTKAPRERAERLLSGLLDVEVDAEPQVAALAGLGLAQVARLHAERVHLHALLAVLAAQEAVVGVLDPRLPDAVAERDAAVAAVLELLLGDLADRAEEVGADLVVRVLAQEDGFRLDAREVVGVLGEVGRPLGNSTSCLTVADTNGCAFSWLSTRSRTSAGLHVERSWRAA